MAMVDASATVGEERFSNEDHGPENEMWAPTRWKDDIVSVACKWQMVSQSGCLRCV